MAVGLYNLYSSFSVCQGASATWFSVDGTICEFCVHLNLETCQVKCYIPPNRMECLATRPPLQISLDLIRASNGLQRTVRIDVDRKQGQS